MKLMKQKHQQHLGPHHQVRVEVGAVVGVNEKEEEEEEEKLKKTNLVANVENLAENEKLEEEPPHMRIYITRGSLQRHHAFRLNMRTSANYTPKH